MHPLNYTTFHLECSAFVRLSAQLHELCTVYPQCGWHLPQSVAASCPEYHSLPKSQIRALTNVLTTNSWPKMSDSSVLYVLECTDGQPSMVAHRRQSCTLGHRFLLCTTSVVPGHSSLIKLSWALNIFIGIKTLLWYQSVYLSVLKTSTSSHEWLTCIWTVSHAKTTFSHFSNCTNSKPCTKTYKDNQQRLLVSWNISW